MRALGAALASLFVKLRLIVILAAVAATVWALVALPAIKGGGGGSSLTSLVPTGSKALAAERLSVQRFGFPLITRTIVVVRDPHGLSAARQTQLVHLAAELSLHRVPRFGAIAGALPLVNTVGSPPLVREHGTTALLYLYFPPSVSAARQTSIARRLAAAQVRRLPGEAVGVTGVAPASAKQDDLIEGGLEWVQLATILLVALAVGIHFRAVGAALLTVGVVLAAYVISERLVAGIGRATGIIAPAEIGPVLVVLVFGVATDYSIFFISRFRSLLQQGVDRRQAAERIVRHISPIVFVAGLTVAAGTAALAVAELEFLRAFGPGLAVAVVIAMVVAVLVVPAALATGGARVFWPSRPDAKPPAPAPIRRALAPARLAARHPVLGMALAAAVVIAAASGLSRIALGDQVLAGLPRGSEAHQAYAQASRGFTPGVIAPALVLVRGHDVAAQSQALSRLQTLLEGQPGVAALAGPREQPPKAGLGITVSPSGNAVRYPLVLTGDPLGAQTIGHAREIERSLPSLLSRAGVRSATGTLAGDSALSAETVDATLGDLGRVTPVMLAAIFIVIALFLRALVAPAYLILTSMLAVLAALGLTVYVMQQLLGYGSLAYYLIFTTVVLLVSLGSDYNVFMVGRIWQEGRRRSLSEAVEVAAARAAKPISTAGLVLALAFAALAIVPVRAFREIAFAMAVGLLIDAFVVRTILMPALLTLVGPRSAWPGKALEEPEPRGRPDPARMP